MFQAAYSLASQQSTAAGGLSRSARSPVLSGGRFRVGSPQVGAAVWATSYLRQAWRATAATSTSVLLRHISSSWTGGRHQKAARAKIGKGMEEHEILTRSGTVVRMN